MTFGDPSLKEKIDLLKNFGIKNEEEVIIAGINGKMNELQAALGMEVIKYLDADRTQRKQLYDTYIQKLKNISGLVLPEVKKNLSRK